MSYHDGWYYLWCSHGICCFNASVYLSVDKSTVSALAGVRGSEHKGPFVDMNGNALDNGGGYITYCSHDYVYAPGGQGVLTGEEGERDVLYYHYCRLLH